MYQYDTKEFDFNLSFYFPWKMPVILMAWHHSGEFHIGPYIHFRPDVSALRIDLSKEGVRAEWSLGLGQARLSKPPKTRNSLLPSTIYSCSVLPV